MSQPIFQESEVVELCAQLIRRRSVNPPGDELAAAQYLAAYLQRAGLDVELLPHGAGRASLLAGLHGAGDRPGLLWVGHLDTVDVGAAPWQRDPFSGDVAQGRVWGRGAADMKGGVAAMAVAAAALARAHAAAAAPLGGDLLLAFTAGEEIDSLGAKQVLLRNLPPVQAVCVAEPSDNQLYIAEKGCLWLEFTTYGKGAHGAMPELGHNAVTDMLAVLAGLPDLPIPCDPHPLLGRHTLSVGTIQGGALTNLVPDRCQATVDLRSVPGQDHAAILRLVQAYLDELAQRRPGLRAEARPTNDIPPVTTAPDDPLVLAFNAALAEVTGQPCTPGGVRYYTDGALYAPALHVPMVICGPGAPGMAHQTDEYVDVQRLVEAAQIYTQAAIKMLG